MEKLSAEEVQQVLGEVPGVIRGLVEENNDLREKLASFTHREEATKIASLMHDKGIDTDVPFKELVERLEKKAAKGELAVIAEAVDMVGPHMGDKIAKVHDGSSTGSSTFEQYILGNVG